MDVSGVSQASAQAAPPTYFQQRSVDLVKLGQALESGDLSGAQDAYNSLQTLAQNSPFGGAAAFGFTRRQQEFNVLGNDLQSGNLAAAQRVFAELRHNRAADPANADGSDFPGPATIVELTIQPTATPAASTTATDTSTATEASAQSSTNQPATDTPAASSAPAASAPPLSPLPDIVINVAQDNSSSPLTIDINLPSPTATAPSASTGSSATSSTANTAPPPEIVINVGNSAAQSEQITLGLAANANGGEQVTLGIGSQQNPNQDQLVINLAQNSNEQIILNLLNAASTGTAAQANGALISINA